MDLDETKNNNNNTAAHGRTTKHVDIIFHLVQRRKRNQAFGQYTLMKQSIEGKMH
jgi:hypothetical protein